MSEFCFYLISWEQIVGFWWNFEYAVLWLTHEIFLNFSTELWPLIDVKISIFLNIFRNNEWILIKLCLCIDIMYMIHVVTNTHYFPELFNRVMPWLILEFCLCSISCEIMGWFDQNLVDTLILFYTKTCATATISTVAGYHVVLITLLFYFE